MALTIAKQQELCLKYANTISPAALLTVPDYFEIVWTANATQSNGALDERRPNIKRLGAYVAMQFHAGARVDPDILSKVETWVTTRHVPKTGHRYRWTGGPGSKTLGDYLFWQFDLAASNYLNIGNKQLEAARLITQGAQPWAKTFESLAKGIDLNPILQRVSVYAASKKVQWAKLKATSPHKLHAPAAASPQELYALGEATNQGVRECLAKKSGPQTRQGGNYALFTSVGQKKAVLLLTNSAATQVDKRSPNWKTAVKLGGRKPEVGTWAIKTSLGGLGTPTIAFEGNASLKPYFEQLIGASGAKHKVIMASKSEVSVLQHGKEEKLPTGKEEIARKRLVEDTRSKERKTTKTELTAKAQAGATASGGTRPGGCYAVLTFSTPDKPLVLLNSTPATPFGQTNARWNGLTPNKIKEGVWAVKTSLKGLGRSTATFSGESELHSVIAAWVRDASVSHSVVMADAVTVKDIREKKDKDKVTLSTLQDLRDSSSRTLQEHKTQSNGYSTGRYTLFATTVNTEPLVLLTTDPKRDVAGAEVRAVQDDLGGDMEPITGLWLTSINEKKESVLYIEGQSATISTFKKSLVAMKCNFKQVNNLTKAEIEKEVKKLSGPPPSVQMNKVLMKCGRDSGFDTFEEAWKQSEMNIRAAFHPNSSAFDALKAQFSKSKILDFLRRERDFPMTGKWSIVLWADPNHVGDVGGFGGGYLYRGNTQLPRAGNPAAFGPAQGWLTVAAESAIKSRLTKAEVGRR